MCRAADSLLWACCWMVLVPAQLGCHSRPHDPAGGFFPGRLLRSSSANARAAMARRSPKAKVPPRHVRPAQEPLASSRQVKRRWCRASRIKARSTGASRRMTKTKADAGEGRSAGGFADRSHRAMDRAGAARRGCGIDPLRHRWHRWPAKTSRHRRRSIASRSGGDRRLA